MQSTRLEDGDVAGKWREDVQGTSVTGIRCAKAAYEPCARFLYDGSWDRVSWGRIGMLEICCTDRRKVWDEVILDMLCNP